MSTDVFAQALDAISKAKDSIKKSGDGNDVDISSTKGTEDSKNKTSDGPETMEDIEKRYAERKKIEDRKDKERSNEINRFQKDVDDLSLSIDLNLRKFLSIQTEDLADDFGLVRNGNIDANSSRNMKALADRQMREQSLLSLRHITTCFTNKKIHDELEGTCTWLDAQHHNHAKAFEKLGVAVSEFDSFRPHADAKEQELVDLLESSEALLTASSSEENVAGGANKLTLLAAKLKDTRDKWKEESSTKIVSAEKEMIMKAGELRQAVRNLESGLSEVRKRGSELDQLLSGTKEGQMREEINSQVKAIGRRYEIHIQRQKKQITDIEAKIVNLRQINEDIRQTIEDNKLTVSFNVSNPSERESGDISKKKKGRESNSNGSDYAIEEFVSECEAVLNRVKEDIPTSQEHLKDLKGLTDDCRDEVASLQSQGQKVKMEISTCVSRQKSKVKALQNELKALTTKKAEIIEASDQIHDRVMALTIAQNRRTQSSVISGNLNLDNEDGQSFLMQAKLAATDVSQITADRVLQKRNDNRFAPGHTRLWPDPNSSDKQDLIHFVEADATDEGFIDEDTTTGGDDSQYEYSSKSHVCEASYRHYALKLLSKDSKGKSKGKKKKGKGNSSSATPAYSHKEAINVCIAIITDLLGVKHLDKAFLNNRMNELKSYSREIPILKPEDVELVIFKDYLVPLINHITSHQINSIVAENKLFTIRVIISASFALLGVLYTCLPIAFDQFSCDLTPHPGFIKHMEGISAQVLKKLLTSTSVKKKEEDQPTSRSAKQKKTKSGKEKSGKDGTEVDDPLHPRTIYQAVELAVKQKTNEFKRIGLYGQIDVIREWVGSTTTRENCKNIHDDWLATSSNGTQCRGKTMYSEDRFGLCAYQILIYELSAFGLQNKLDNKYKKLSPASLANLKECLDNIKRPSSTYTTEFSDIEALMTRVTPCSVPLLIALEFTRKVIDEELARQSIYTAIANGTHEDLQFLKSSRASTAASRVSTASREEAFLKGLPADERRYLQDMQMTINLAVDDVLEAFENSAEDADDYDTVKISEFLKKHIIKHMYILDDIVFGPFDNEALAKVKSEVYKFQKHIKALTVARNKTLDVGGEYTRPLRNKLDKLNNDLASNLERFYHKCYQNKMHEAEIIEMQQETSDLYIGNRNVIKGTFNYYPDDMERISMLINNDTERLMDRLNQRQQLKDECRGLKSELLALKGHHNEIKSKLLEMGNEMSYNSAEASAQGAHIILSLLAEFLQFTERKQAALGEDDRANVAELMAIQRRRKMATNSEIDTEKILRHILSYFSEEDFALLGAVFLDETISRSLSQELEIVVAEQNARLRGQLLRKQSTRIEEFNMTEEKESKFRNGTGIDPRNMSNRRGHRMSVVQMDSFVHDDSLPTVLVASDEIPFPPKSREGSGPASRRPSVAGFNDTSRPSSQSRRPTSHELAEHGRHTPSSADRTVLPLSRESDMNGNHLLDKFLNPPDGQQQRDFKSIVPPGEKLLPFNDSECTSLRTATISTLTTKTKETSEKMIPLVNVPKHSTSRKATLALLPGGDGKVESYVAS